jgi:hypothetical protein
MSKVTDLASSQINSHDTITVELIEADETPAVVIIRWAQQSLCDSSPPIPRHGRHGGEIVCSGCHPARSDQEGPEAVRQSGVNQVGRLVPMCQYQADGAPPVRILPLGPSAPLLRSQ